MDTVGRDEEAEGTQAGVDMQELSNAMVRLYKEQFGRGPTRARTHWAGTEQDVAAEVFYLEPLSP